MSSRGIARLFYWNKVLLYVIYLYFWKFYFQYVLRLLSMLSVGLTKPQWTWWVLLFVFFSYWFKHDLHVISFGRRREISSFLLALWKNSSKHFNVVSRLYFGWYDATTWDNIKSTLKQPCFLQRWNLQRWTMSNQRCVFQRWYEQR